MRVDPPPSAALRCPSCGEARRATGHRLNADRGRHCDAPTAAVRRMRALHDGAVDEAPRAVIEACNVPIRLGNPFLERKTVPA
jgi:hypothetical protein